ncbi:hypothetical protein [Streptomyces heilongjiangensis]|uniref:LexA repressor DNA-binding domain-containing protein n=1 Tax=Streptomyces heilongjiangensis TaxID=945052 RepID=A0ABW1BJF0_9ACTN|nr:hypothetical protein [Streptomyces heilongjiangensis]MDC2952633.1 hypothetical protein [Streptomyces heilongjiangensis]
MHEIGQAVGLSSTSSVAHQLIALERKGFLRRDPHRPRAYEVRGSDQAAAQPTDTVGKPAASYVPLVGRIAAGRPILAEKSVEDVFPLPRQLVGDGGCVAEQGELDVPPPRGRDDRDADTPLGKIVNLWLRNSVRVHTSGARHG